MFRTLSILALALAGCATPPPTCSATDEPYGICSGGKLWTCPEASAEALADKQALLDSCDDAEDEIACITDLDLEMFETQLDEDCEANGRECVDDRSNGTASCVDP